MDVEDLMEYGVWVVTLLCHHPPGPCENNDSFISEVPVCALDIRAAEAAAQEWTVKDRMVPEKTLSIQYVCGVKAVKC